MNILYLLDNPQLYGSELHLLDIIKFMSRSNNVILIGFKKGPLLELLDQVNIKYYVIPSGYNISLINTKKIIKIIKIYKIDFIHAHQPKALFIGALLKIMTHIPLITTIHSTPQQQACIYKMIKRIFVYAFHFIMDFISKSLSNKIIYVSRYMYSKSLYKKKSVFISNWIRTSLISENIKKNINSSPNEMIKFLAVGSVTASKGYHELFELIDYLINKNFLNFEFDIVGGIDYNFLKLEKIKFNKEVFKKINFSGYVSNVQEFYEKADFFILLTKAETFGLVFIEAMLFSLPIISSDITVLKDIIPPENSLTNDFDQIYDFINNYYYKYDNYIEICKSNKEYVKKKFNFNKCMTKLNTVYSEIIRVK